MWFEAVLGLCLGCELYRLMVRHGWRTEDDAFEICPNGACDVRVDRGVALATPATIPGDDPGRRPRATTPGDDPGHAHCRLSHENTSLSRHRVLGDRFCVD